MFSDVAVTVIFSSKRFRASRAVGATSIGAVVNGCGKELGVLARLVPSKIFPESKRILVVATLYFADEAFVVNGCRVSTCGS